MAKATKRIDEPERLEMICSAIRHCQSMKRSGAPAATYSKALREPVFFLWETDGRAKDACARFRSAASIGVARGMSGLIYDHVVPFKLLQEQLLALDPVEPMVVKGLLEAGTTAALITSDENARLNELGLQSRMPDGWDGVDALARYRAAGIEIVENVGAAVKRPPNPRRAGRSRPSTRTATGDSSAPTDHDRFRASSVRVQAVCRELFSLFGANGYVPVPPFSRDGISFTTDLGPSFRVDPKIESVRVRIGKSPSVVPPSELVHAGKQPEWLVVTPETGRVALQYLAELITTQGTDNG